MLDFFSIFSKGGILLWCFKGAGLLPKEWEAFTPTVNELIKSVLLQERAVKKNYWECGQLDTRMGDRLQPMLGANDLGRYVLAHSR